jgi:nitroreductase/NAD-dependent dihydropyrimidine dehydrogenase PreA subunit
VSWVSIDESECNQCGLCVTRCASCFSSENDVVTVQADEATCNLCGHCVSLCPTDAIHHQQMDMGNFPPMKKAVPFDTQQFLEFLRQRRSHRHFTSKEIPRAQLEILVDACRYAPTGSNRQSVAIKLIRDPDRVALFSNLTVDYFMNMFANVETQIQKLEAEGQEIPEPLAALHATGLRYQRMGTARELGMDVIFYKAPCVMVFHSSPQQATTPKDDCMIAAQTVSMLARTMKLETCYIGLFNAAANAHPLVTEELGLPPGHKVYSVLILGYPKLRYLRAVDRKPIEVTWE